MKKNQIYIFTFIMLASQQIYCTYQQSASSGSAETRSMRNQQLIADLHINKKPVKVPDFIKKSDILNMDVQKMINRRRAITDSLLIFLRYDTIQPVEIKRKRVDDLLYERGVIDLNLVQYQQLSVCAKAPLCQPIEFFIDSSCVSQECVSGCGPQVGQLQWNWKFIGFDPKSDDMGRVAGERWGSGSLIAPDLYLTAGHCLNGDQDGWRMPKKSGNPLSYTDVAKLMHVQFNYEFDRQFQLDSQGHGRIRADTVDYPVLDVLEYHYDQDGTDYAILKLGRDKDHKLPGERFNILKIDTNFNVNINDTVFIVQYPDGRDKVVGCGTVRYVDNYLLYYDNINTDGGSSGAPVISGRTRAIVGVHIKGDCEDYHGSNQALTIAAIKKISRIIK